MDILYIVEECFDMGLSNGKFGMWFFFVLEVMFFGSLFLVYVLLCFGV